MANLRVISCAAVLLVALACPSLTSAVTITFTANDLVDTTPGEDLWQYSYLVGNATFPPDTGFTIYFDYLRYSDLAVAGPALADWDQAVAQPSQGLTADGFFDALSLANPASLVDPFLVNFVWLGKGLPGTQPFEVYSLSGQFAVIEGGRTVSNVVPEPSTLLLVGAGVGLIGAIAARRRRSR